MSVLKSPRHYAGPALEKDYRLAADSQTWKAGEFGYFDSNGQAYVCARGATKVQFQFAQDQDTSTSSSSVWIMRIPSEETKFLGWVVNAGTDTRAEQTLVGESAGLYVSSNVHSLNTANDTAIPFIIEEIYSNKDKSAKMTTTSECPGQVIFRVDADYM